MDVQCPSANVTVLHAEEESSSSLLDLDTGKIYAVELNAAYLLQMLQSDTPRWASLINLWKLKICTVYHRRGANSWKVKVISVHIHLQSLSGSNIRFSLSPGQQTCMHQCPCFVLLTHSFIHPHFYLESIVFKQHIHHGTLAAGCLPSHLPFSCRSVYVYVA